MENTNLNSKIVTISFMTAAILIGLVVSVLLESLAAVSVGGFGRFIAQDYVQHGLPVIIGLLSFFALQFNKKIVSWAEDVVTELRKIVWPSRKDTTAMTIVVCVMLLISGAVLGLMDFVSSKVIETLLQYNFLGIFS